MKKTILLGILSLLIGVMFTSCKKTEAGKKYKLYVNDTIVVNADIPTENFRFNKDSLYDLIPAYFEFDTITEASVDYIQMMTLEIIKKVPMSYRKETLINGKFVYQWTNVYLNHYIISGTMSRTEPRYFSCTIPYHYLNEQGEIINTVNVTYTSKLSEKPQ